MRIGGLLVAGALAVPALGAAHAQDAERFRLEKTENGLVRMDTATGQMSLCQQNGDEFVCRMASDDRSAYAARLGRMQARLDALERRVDALETSSPTSGAVASDEELDRSLGMMEKFMRRFMGIARDIEREQKQQDQSGPNRT